VWEDNWVDFDGFIAELTADIEYDQDQRVRELIMIL